MLSMTDHPLVSTDWLAEHLHAPHIRIVDIRGHVAPPTDPLPHYYHHHEDYLRSHIPDAVFVDWVREITDPDDPHHAKVAPPQRFEEVMRRHGIANDTVVVVYDDAQGMFAARLWWMLNYFGHVKVAIVDGGWQKWTREGRPVSDVIPHYAPTDFVADPQPEWHRTAAQVAQSLAGNTILIDARSPAEFAGDASRASRAGHIPGAINVPRTSLVNADGTLKPPHELRTLYAQVGVTDPTQQVITYCNGGVSASFELLALRIAGFGKVANYDGSWKEWGNDDTRPIKQP
jgi:thiosulfate/3-mercaptopyruvate sulfurtransferase